MTDPILSIEGLQRLYAGRTVVHIERLEVASGELLAILGPNGAGKSTLFRMLLLLERPDAGRILLDGREVRAGDTAAMRRMAGVFQKPFMFDGTVADNVAYGLRARAIRADERARRVTQAMEWLGLTALGDVPARRISGGEAQRVALARALAVEPDILLLDEPTSNLDVTVRRRFREDLERLARTRARAAVLITHDPTDAFSLADRIAVMQDGRVVQVATPEELVMDPATPFIATFTGAELLLDGVIESADEGLVAVRLEGGALVWASLRDGRGDAGPGRRVHVAYRPEDVVLALPDNAGETSAINRFETHVSAIVPAGALVRVRLSGAAPLAALVTRRSAEALELAPGRPVIAQMKATALRAFPAGGA